MKARFTFIEENGEVRLEMMVKASMRRRRVRGRRRRRRRRVRRRRRRIVVAYPSIERGAIVSLKNRERTPRSSVLRVGEGCLSKIG